MSQEFNNALNDCLERVSQGENLQKCLSEYPQYREELGPLVQVAVSTIQEPELSIVLAGGSNCPDRTSQEAVVFVQLATSGEANRHQSGGGRCYGNGRRRDHSRLIGRCPRRIPLLGQNHKRERPASIESFGRQQGANSCRSGKRSR